MSAPDTKKSETGEPFDALKLCGTFSEAVWRDVEESLAERGVDFSAETVGQRLVQGGRLLLPHDSTAPQRSLRDVLQDIAWRYAARARLPKPPTPIQQAKDSQEELAAYQEALAMLSRSYYRADGDLDENQSLARVEINTALGQALTQKIAELQEHIAKLRAKGSRSKENSRTVHGDYWHALARLWLEITGSAGPKRRQRLRGFLLACTPPTLFPDLTAPELKRSVDGFLSNLHRDKSKHRRRSRAA